MPNFINITFTNGVGQLNAKLFRRGEVIWQGQTKVSAQLNVPDLVTDDVLSLDGVCAEQALLAINAESFPATPMNFERGDFLGNFIFL